MKHSRRVGIRAVCIGLLAPAALAQSVYIDFGDTPPFVTYGAAAGIPGMWNASHMPSTNVPLIGLQGEATGLLFTASGCDQAFEDFPSTNGDDGALLDDWFYGDCAFSNEQIRVTGLNAGSYELRIYPKGGPGGFIAGSVSITAPGIVGGGAGFSMSATGEFTGSIESWPHFFKVLHALVDDTQLIISYSSEVSSGLAGMQLVLFEEPSATGTAYCFGDGSGAACPCFNDGPFGHGCGNLIYPQGARLTASGTASVSADTLVLSATQMSGAFSWYFQATAQAQDPLGYGILCVGGSLLRIGQKALTNGASTNPSGVDFPISVKGAIPPAGGTRHYQVSYRQANPPCSPTPTTNTNRTNGLTIVWTP